MTTRDELVAQFLFAKFNHSDFRWNEILEYEKDGWRADAKEALRLASRQEVSVTVEELARLIDPRIVEDVPGIKWGRFELQRRELARDKARPLLAKYSITNRTE